MNFKVIGKDGSCYAEFINLAHAEKWMRNHKKIFPEHCKVMQFEIKEVADEG